MYEQRDTSVPRKHQADYTDRGNRGATKIRNTHRVVYGFKFRLYKTPSMFVTQYPYRQVHHSIHCT